MEGVFVIIVIFLYDVSENESEYLHLIKVISQRIKLVLIYNEDDDYMYLYHTRFQCLADFYYRFRGQGIDTYYAQNRTLIFKYHKFYHGAQKEEPSEQQIVLRLKIENISATDYNVKRLKNMLDAIEQQLVKSFNIPDSMSDFASCYLMQNQWFCKFTLVIWFVKVINIVRYSNQ